MDITKAEGKNIVHKLQESLQSARKSDDRLLVYLIERALFQAEKFTAEVLPSPNSDTEQNQFRPSMLHSHRSA